MLQPRPMSNDLPTKPFDSLFCIRAEIPNEKISFTGEENLQEEVAKKSK